MSVDSPSLPLEPPTRTPPDALPLRIADHELLRPIASGSYGEVWLARSAVGTLRAVKLVRRDRFERTEDFEREFKGLQRFEPVSRGHDGLVDILQIGRPDEGEWFYYVMELADAAEPQASNQCSVISNQSPATTPDSPLNTDPLITDYSPLTLRAHFRARGALPADEVITLGLALTAALAHLHGQGLVHRDIKPSNILFVGGVPKLADAGLVAPVDDARSLVGTVGYLAPEGPGSPRADLYALGKVLYEAAFGKDRQDFPQLPPDLASRPDHARLLELNAIIATACAHDPKQRYSNAEAMLTDLKLLDAGKSVKRRHSVQRGWTWTWKMAVALALVALAFVLIRNERDRRAALARLNASPFEKSGTTNYAAWQAWQRALQMGNTYTTVGLSNAIQEWERATELDPNYLAAWSTLSVTITIAVSEGHFAGTNLLPRAKACAEKAIALNPKIGAPYLALAQCNLALDYDFARAEPLFRKCLELGPPHWSHRNNFARALLDQGRFGEAEQLFERVRQETPEQGGPYVALGILSWLAGRQADGLALFDEGIRLAPDRPLWRS